MHRRIDDEDLSFILQRTSTLWDELRNQNLFIAGGTGFFGHWLVESFIYANDHLGLNAKVTILSRNPEAFAQSSPLIVQHPSITILKGDIRTFDFPAGDFPLVIHAATEARAKMANEEPQLMFDTIIEGTRHLLDFASVCGTRKLLFTSSGAVYGKQPAELSHIPEDYLGGPNPVDVGSAYGEGKRAAEMLCALYSKRYGFSVKIARCFAFVGPFLPLDAHFAIGNFIRDALNSDSIVVRGDGTPLRSYLYAADLAIWLWTILFMGQNCQAYNVGSANKVSISELAKEISQKITPRVPVKFINSDPVRFDNYNYVPSVSKTEKELNLSVLIDRSEGIDKTIKWYKKVEE